MFKVLPCVLKLKQYSDVNKHIIFWQIFCLIKYLGHHFCSHAITSILSEAELRAELDGA